MHKHQNIATVKNTLLILIIKKLNINNIKTILSPIIHNFMLHLLDIYMEKLYNGYNKLLRGVFYEQQYS